MVIIITITTIKTFIIVMMATREEGLPEELVALMEDMKSAQKKANLEENGKESLSLLTQWRRIRLYIILSKLKSSFVPILYQCTKKANLNVKWNWMHIVYPWKNVNILLTPTLSEILIHTWFIPFIVRMWKYKISIILFIIS